MDLDDLKTFIEVADSGGVSQASRRLGLDKSVVSRRLARLEHTLATQLFSRTTRGSVLTEAGSIFKEHAIRAIEVLDNAQEAMSVEGTLIGRLRIAAPLSFGLSQLSPVFAELARRHPLLHIDTVYNDRFVDLVNEGADCAIRLGLLPDSNLIARRIFACNGCLVASPAYLESYGTPTTLDELLQHRLVVKTGEVWRLNDGKNVFNVRPQGRFTTDNGEAVLSAILAGVGIGGMPDFLIHQHIKDKKLIALLPQYTFPELGMYVVRPAGQFPNRKVRALIDILIEYFGDQTINAVYQNGSSGSVIQ